MINHRRKLLRQIELNVVLPTYTDAACAMFETEKDKQANNRVFTEAIKDLFAQLRSWYDEAQPTENVSDNPVGRPLRLCLGDIYSPKDSRYRGWERYQEDYQEWKCGRRHDLFKRRYKSSLLRLESIEGIRELPQISSFVHDSPGHRHVEPRSLAVIASKIPNLDSVLWRLEDIKNMDPRLRQQTRFGGSIFILPA